MTDGHLCSNNPHPTTLKFNEGMIRNVVVLERGTADMLADSGSKGEVLRSENGQAICHGGGGQEAKQC